MRNLHLHLKRVDLNLEFAPEMGQSDPTCLTYLEVVFPFFLLCYYFMTHVYKLVIEGQWEKKKKKNDTIHACHQLKVQLANSKNASNKEVIHRIEDLHGLYWFGGFVILLEPKWHQCVIFCPHLQLGGLCIINGRDWKSHTALVWVSRRW